MDNSSETVIRKHVIIYCKTAPLSPEPADRTGVSNESYGSALVSPSSFFVPSIKAIESPPGALLLKNPPEISSPFNNSVASMATKFSINSAVVSDQSLQESLEKFCPHQTEDCLFEDIFSGDLGTSGYGTFRTPGKTDFSTEFQNSLTQKMVFRVSQTQKNLERQASESLFKTPQLSVDYSVRQHHSQRVFGDGPSTSLSHSSGYCTFEIPRIVSTQMQRNNESDMDIDVELSQRPVMNEFTSVEEIPDSVTIPESPECRREQVNSVKSSPETKVLRCQSPDMFASTDDEHVSPKVVSSDNSEMSQTYENFSEYISPEAGNFVHDTSFRSKHSTPVFQRRSQAPVIYEQHEPKIFQHPACAASNYHPLFHHFFTQELDAMNDEPEDGERVYGQSCPAYFHQDPVERRAETIIVQIEDLIQSLLHSLMTDNDMVIRIRKQTEWTNTQFEDERVCLKTTEDADYKEINFRNKNSERKFAIILHLLSEIHKLMITGATCTPRELYYRDPELFENQTDVNQAIREICCLLETTPWELGIMSTSKGLVAGDLKIITANDETIDCSTEGGILLPHSIAGLKRLETEARFVLLVEKDTVFKKLLDSLIFDKLGNDIILVTGKGYPDLNTRLLLKKIFDQHGLPIYALTDADPHGIEIMFTYRFGSLAQSHNSNHLAIPSIRWIGVHPSDIQQFQLPTLQLTSEDESKLKDILKRPYMNAAFHHQIHLMLSMKLKAEIEGVSAIDMNYLIDEYIPMKIGDNIFL